ncbi:MAG: hypothetical protein WCP99_22005 [Burkholderiales bacterium]
MPKFSVGKSKDNDNKESLPNEIPAASVASNTFNELTRKMAGKAHEAIAETTGKARSMRDKFPIDDFMGMLGQFNRDAKKFGRTLTGEAFVDAAGKLLDRQMQYNNVLATRLAEALESIEVLKSRVHELEKKNEN